MKKLILGLAFSLGASAALAGGYEAPADPPVMSPVIVEQQAASSSARSPYSVLGTLTLIVFAVGLTN